MDILSLISDYNYAEIRVEKRTSNTIKLNDNELSVSSGTLTGISARVLEKGSWGFSSSNDLSDLNSLLKRAQRIAKLNNGSVSLPESSPIKATVNIQTDIHNHSIEEKTKWVLNSVKEMKSDKLKNKIINLSEFDTHKEFYSSYGSEIYQQQVHIYLSASATVRENSILQRGHERAASTDTYKKINFELVAEEASEQAHRLLGAKSPPKGKFKIVIDPELTGVFSHEALGHATEADSIIERESILAGKLDTKIGNELVTIIDDPSAKDFGFYVYDDEGVEAKAATLVQNGVLKSYLNSKETGKRLNLKFNGHCRAEDFGSFPIVRMANTYFQPHDASIEEVMEIKEGYYLKGMRGGSVDIFSGGFMFKAEEAYEIKNGEIGAIIRDTALSGNILEALNNVELVGKDFGTSPGICGKFGQSAPVSDGGPHIRVDGIKLG
ncbi:TldD/PmbA family protein [Candidatus Micrarchaeota archaeon]|nr:TldD/PmbA family protein [Candidatus Micrarchaeota archaeon]